MTDIIILLVIILIGTAFQNFLLFLILGTIANKNKWRDGILNRMNGFLMRNELK
jgi:hypothetical protein